MKLKPWFVFLLLCTPALSAADCYVATHGSDAADGSASHPLRTIQKGIDAVSRLGGTVVVSSGTYRESLSLKRPREPGSQVVLKAAQKQSVTLDGAERVQGWRLADGGRNVWTKEFGAQAPYNNDHGRWDMAPRSEQVFVNGKRCDHVKEDVSYDAVPEYGFTVTLSDPARYVLRLPKGLSPDTATIEITTRGSLLDVWGENIVIDGFVFRRARNTYQQAMVTLHGETIELCNCLLEYSSAGSGLAVQCRHSRIHDNTFRSNGQFGFSMGGSDNVLENNVVEGNDLAGYKEWGTGGTKIVGSGNVIRRNRFLGNLGGVAIWLDCGPSGNVVEYNYVSGNYGEGIRAEISFHSYIGFNIVEDTRPCTATMFGKTHCIGISVQNSAETCVVHNLVKDNHGIGIQLSTYNRTAADLPKWQRHDERQREWLRRSWDAKIVYAYDNLFFNNAVIRTSTAPGASPGSACVFLMGLVNDQRPHCYGNQFDYNFYWDAATQSPKVQIRNLSEVPGGKSQWQLHYGMDTHSLGSFLPEDYRQPAFAAEYPYGPTATFAGIGKGKDLKDLPWHAEIDFVGHPLSVRGAPSMAHIEYVGK